MFESKKPSVLKEESSEPKHLLNKRQLTHFLNSDTEFEKIYIEEPKASPPSKKPSFHTPRKKLRVQKKLNLDDTADTRGLRSKSKAKQEHEASLSQNNILNAFKDDPDEAIYSDPENVNVNNLFFVNLVENKESVPQVERAERPSKKPSEAQVALESDKENDPTYQPKIDALIKEWNQENAKQKPLKQKLGKTGRGKARGQYNMLNLDKRNEIVTFANKFGVERAYNKFKICKSRIRRYLNNGTIRKKGGGRKTLDPDMERNLLNWIEEATKTSGSFPNRGLIKSRAKTFSKVKKFLASKGWCDKFFKRNVLRLEKIKKSIDLGAKNDQV